MFFGRIVFCAACMWLGVSVAHPFLVGAALTQKNESVERSINLIRVRNQELTRDIRAFETKEGVEKMGRLHGYAFPNERRLNIPE